MISSSMARIIPAVICLCLGLAFAILLLPQVADAGRSGSKSAILSSIAESANAAKTGKVKTAQAIGPAIGLGAKADFPKLTGRVVDLAKLLSPQEEADLIAKLAAFEEKSSDQLVVATITSLNGENLEDYANQLFRHWGLGQAQENNGVLLLVSKNDRKLRIEVGYGLEGTLTDAASKLIIDNIIVPSFKVGEFGKGITQGADMIISVLSGDSAELEARARRNISTSDDEQVDWPFIVFITIWATLFFGPIAIAILVPMFGEKLGPGHYKWLGIEVKPSKGGSRSGWGSGRGGGSSGGGFFRRRRVFRRRRRVGRMVGDFNVS